MHHQGSHTKKNIYTPEVLYAHSLLEKCWRISLHVTDGAIAKLYVTYSLVKW